MNTLLNQPFLTPYQTPPFSTFNENDFIPAIEEAIKEAKVEIDNIVQSEIVPTFENTIEALDFSGEKLNRISSIFFNLNSAETNENMQRIAQEISPWLAAFANDIVLNQQLFNRVKHVYETQNSYNLNTEQLELLRKTYKKFSRNGALLNKANQEKIREIDKKLAQLSLQFGENVLAETNDFQLHIIQDEDLDGLPQFAKDMAKEEAKQNEKEGWIFTLQMPSYLSFLKYYLN